MRLLLTFEHDSNQVIPINYQSLISAWIYRTLSEVDAQMATKLHDEGYDFQGKKFKLFTFSFLHLQQPFLINGKAQTITLQATTTQLEISFNIAKTFKSFVAGLFTNQFFTIRSGQHFNVQFRVAQVQILPAPKFENIMQFRLQTPLCISIKETGKKYAQYLSPEDERYGQLLLNNLINKQAAIQKAIGESPKKELHNAPYGFRLLTVPKLKGITSKGIKTKGYLFDFEIIAPTPLLEIGYYAGFGEKNSYLGFGLVKEKNVFKK